MAAVGPGGAGDLATTGTRLARLGERAVFVLARRAVRRRARERCNARPHLGSAAAVRGGRG